ncbi:MAG: hypothetical protein CL912_21140 [Deltaproteobacteria bacterium]|nr:hypothetical protein [Deltaproteobacteria bacterium]
MTGITLARIMKIPGQLLVFPLSLLLVHRQRLVRDVSMACRPLFQARTGPFSGQFLISQNQDLRSGFLDSGYFAQGPNRGTAS